MEIKNPDDRFIIIEPLLLYATFFLQGIFATNGEAAELFQSSQMPFYFFIAIITQVPQILLMLYIIFLRKDVPLSRFGITPLQHKEVGYGILILFGLLAISMVTFQVYQELGFSMENQGIQKVNIGPTWSLPLLFLFCLSTGYREELFFRSYLLIRFKQWGLSAPVGVMISTLLFGVLHLYQGIFGFIFTSFAGLYFAFIFLKTQNLHMIAIGHGLYNFFMFLSSSFSPPPS